MGDHKYAQSWNGVPQILSWHPPPPHRIAFEDRFVERTIPRNYISHPTIVDDIIVPRRAALDNRFIEIWEHRVSIADDGGLIFYTINPMIQRITFHPKPDWPWRCYHRRFP